MQASGNLSTLDIAVSAIGAGLWEWPDVNSDQEWWSPKFYELLGYEPDEVDATLSNFAALLHPDDKKRTFDLVNAHFTRDKPFDIEYRLRTKSGKYRWFKGNGKVARDEDGNPTRMVGSIIDIHKRKLAEARLQRSNERIRHMIAEVSDHSIIGLDANGKIKSWNVGAQEISGYTQEEAIGKPISIFFSQEDINAKKPEQLLSTARKESRARNEGWRERKNGEKYWAASAVTAIHGNSGKVIGFTKITRDLSEVRAMQLERQKYTENLERANLDLKHQEEKYLDQNTTFEQVLDSAMAGYWDWYIQEDREYMSPRFKRMFGYEDHELPNRPDTWQRLIHPDDLPGVFASYEAHVSSKGEIPYDNEVRYYHKDGSIVWVYCRGKVIDWDEEGNPVRMVGSHVDITSLKEAEKIIGEKVAELEFQNKELEQFVYIASHDLQEPLRTTASFLELLSEKLDGSLDEETSRYFMHIQNSSRRMRKLVSDLLDYSRVGRKKEIAKVDSKVLVEELLSDLEVRIQETNATVTVGKLPVVIARGSELKQVFQNLISNALKFRAPGVAPKVKVDCIEEKTQWHFCVSDNGIGIAKEHRDRIFVIFQRLHTKSEYPGTGIGLAICAKIAEIHGGSIWVTKNKGGGSIFHFTINKKPNGKEV